MSLIF